jgi:hypothetical protein
VRRRRHQFPRRRANRHVRLRLGQNFVSVRGEHRVQILVRKRFVAFLNLTLPAERVVLLGGHGRRARRRRRRRQRVRVGGHHACQLPRPGRRAAVAGHNQRRLRARAEMQGRRVHGHVPRRLVPATARAAAGAAARGDVRGRRVPPVAPPRLSLRRRRSRGLILPLPLRLRALSRVVVPRLFNAPVAFPGFTQRKRLARHHRAHRGLLRRRRRQSRLARRLLRLLALLLRNLPHGVVPLAVQLRLAHALGVRGLAIVPRRRERAVEPAFAVVALSVDDASAPAEPLRHSVLLLGGDGEIVHDRLGRRERRQRRFPATRGERRGDFRR